MPVSTMLMAVFAVEVKDRQRVPGRGMPHPFPRSPPPPLVRDGVATNLQEPAAPLVEIAAVRPRRERDAVHVVRGQAHTFSGL